MLENRIFIKGLELELLTGALITTMSSSSSQNAFTTMLMTVSLCKNYTTNILDGSHLLDRAVSWGDRNLASVLRLLEFPNVA